MSHAKEEEFYSLFGKLALQFSKLEWIVGSLLLRLVDAQDQVLGGLLVGDLMLSKKIDLISKLAPYRLFADEDLLNEILACIKQVTAVRINRNLFVHGNWTTDEKSMLQGIAYVRDDRLKPKIHGKGSERILNMGKSKTEWTFDDLRDEQTKVSTLVANLLDLTNRVEQTKQFSLTLLNLEVPVGKGSGTIVKTISVEELSGRHH